MYRLLRLVPLLACLFTPPSAGGGDPGSGNRHLVADTTNLRVQMLAQYLERRLQVTHERIILIPCEQALDRALTNGARDSLVRVLRLVDSIAPAERCGTWETPGKRRVIRPTVSITGFTGIPGEYRPFENPDHLPRLWADALTGPQIGNAESASFLVGEGRPLLLQLTFQSLESGDNFHCAYHPADSLGPAGIRC